MAVRSVTVITSGGGDYSTLNAAENGELAISGDLVTDQDTLEITCSGGQDSSFVDFPDTSWTCDATYNITLIGEGIGSAWNSGIYHLKGVATTGVTPNLALPLHSVVRDMQIDRGGLTTAASVHSAISLSDAGGVGTGILAAQVINCYVRDSYTRSGSYISNGCLFGRGSGTADEVHLINCIFEGFSQNGIRGAGYVDLKVIGCTIRNCGYAVLTTGYGIYERSSAGATIVATNTIVYNSTDGDFEGTITKTYCASGDATASGTGCLASISDPFVSATDSALAQPPVGTVYSAGSDVSGTYSEWATDPLGATRFRYSMGAFELRDIVTRTVTVKPGGGGNYTSLQTALSTEKGDITFTTGSNEIVRIECSKGTTGSGLDAHSTWISPASADWTTDATHYVEIVGTETHGGAWNTNIYRCVMTSDGNGFYVGNASGLRHYRLTNFQMGHSYAGGLQCGNWRAETYDDEVIADGCIFYSGTGWTNNQGVNVWLSSHTAACDQRVRNSLIYGTNPGNCVRSSGTTGNGRFENCTIYGCGNHGIACYIGSIVVTNCVVYGTGASDYNFTTVGTVTVTYSADEDGTIPAGTGNFTLTADPFVNAGTDFHLNQIQNTDDVHKAGTSMAGSFTTDLDGVTRNRWSVGALEYDGIVTALVNVDTDGGGDYVGLNSAATAEERDLTSSAINEVCQFTCTGSAADSLVDISTAWTTDATRYVSAIGDTPTAGVGVWDTARYRSDNSTTTTQAINARAAYTRLKWIQARTTGVTTGAVGIRLDANNVRVDSCLGIGRFNGATNLDVVVEGIYIGFGWTSCLVVNSVGVTRNLNTGLPNFAFGVGTGNTNATFYNCLGYADPSYGGINVGMYSGGAGSVAKNCVGVGGTAGFSASGWSGSSYNASEDATQPGTSGQSGTIAFVDRDNDDYRLLTTDTVCLDNGVDLSADPTFAFSVDYFGTTRSAWSIGPFEVGVAPTFLAAWARNSNIYLGT